jgi:hypothetical protein
VKLAVLEFPSDRVLQREKEKASLDDGNYFITTTSFLLEKMVVENTRSPVEGKK